MGGLLTLAQGGEEEEVSEEVQKLIEAAETGDEASVKKLIAEGVSITEGMLGVTPLMVAAANAHPGVCALLLASGAEVNAHDEDGLSALDWAEDLEDEVGDAVRKVLVDAGGLPGVSPLHTLPLPVIVHKHSAVSCDV